MKKNLLFILLALLCTNITAKELDTTITLTKQANKHSINSQKKIDLLVIKKEKLYSKFKIQNYELKSLNNYNIELNEIINSQNSEKKSILNQIDEIDKTKREILPLIKNMLISLDEMIQNDIPFLPKERAKRIKRLKHLMKRSDVSIATKYRAVIEAYEIETQYSRTIETYNDILETQGLSKNVKFLRIGRIALYYVTENNKESAIWDKETKDWNILDAGYSKKLNKAIKIAAKKGVPNLLNLPMFSAKEVL
ncbi:DUF3450 domain-containing protein [Sulfurimonas sp.]|uniref:DUF3450 domain-containing protein n=1 Tax=Sulfurimonas sp. TaxID=2022749 RepID=UPI002B487155|nr:DUF3450 domain-containing protein [Sulfurimonas sp.]